VPGGAAAARQQSRAHSRSRGTWCPTSSARGPRRHHRSRPRPRLRRTSRPLLDAVARGKTVTHIFVTHTHSRPFPQRSLGSRRQPGALVLAEGSAPGPGPAPPPYRRGAAHGREQRRRLPFPIARSPDGEVVNRPGLEPSRAVDDGPAIPPTTWPLRCKEADLLFLGRSRYWPGRRPWSRPAGWGDERLHGLAAKARAARSEPVYLPRPRRPPCARRPVSWQY